MAAPQETPWPRPIDNMDEFPLVEERGFFQIRVDYSDPLSWFANTVLENHKDQRRYLCVFIEDGLVTQGMYDLNGARSLIDRLTIVKGNFVDPSDQRDSDAKITDCLKSLEPIMEDQEKKDYAEALEVIKNLKRIAQSPNN